MEFREEAYYEALVRGDVGAAIEYLRRFPEQSARLAPLERIFVEEGYVSYDIAPELDRVLLMYQRYYREVFYLRREAKEAERHLRDALAELLAIDDDGVDLDTIEQEQLVSAFKTRGLYFMGGRTEGCRGPYVWRTAEDLQYTVELPEGRQEYVVRFLGDFVTKSWLDFISQGEISTGGWTDRDGVICCISSCYDLDSEEFQVSLLKHEAQHTMDLARWPDMSSDMLEYRAKLVEAVYSTRRDMLTIFLREAAPTQMESSHAAAARRIVEGFKRQLGCDEKGLESLSIPQIQETALVLFHTSIS